MRAVVLPALLDALTASGHLAFAKEVAMRWQEGSWLSARTFLKSWAQEDPIAAGSWLGVRITRADGFFSREPYWRLEDWPDKRFFLALTASSRCVHQPDGGPRSFPSGIGKMLGELAGDDLSEAQEWLLKMPPSVVTKRMVRQFVEGWAKHDPIAAQAYTERVLP